ncbi:hypothetical protein [Streptomyces sp. BBFR109]|uniref:hypothetical protein n=1 Tax=Streptomyces sp. BBFR109 TaxID=3448172 RepID=UPI003F768434
MTAKTPLSGDELRNTLQLDILYDTNVQDIHIERLVSLIEQEAAKRVETERTFLYKKYKELWAGLMAIKPHLDKPFPDDPRWTPWSRFVHPRMVMLQQAFKGNDVGELEAMGDLSDRKAGDAN